MAHSMPCYSGLMQTGWPSRIRPASSGGVDHEVVVEVRVDVGLTLLDSREHALVYLFALLPHVASRRSQMTTSGHWTPTRRYVSPSSSLAQSVQTVNSRE